MMHAVINHLWQSTVFAILAGILALAFRRNRAQVRYWLWFSASVKFLVPFALLLSLGGYLGRSPVAKSLPMPAISHAMVEVAEPFPVHAPAVPPAQTPPQTPIDWIPIVLVSLWMCGFLSVTLSRFRAWLQIRAALRSSTPLEIFLPVPVRSTTHLLEPGVVGFFRPRLLLPVGIKERLTPEQLQDVLTHELCHVRRRDNLTATIHMIAEAFFWFHPLVWWIGARLMEERERACDEAVLESGGEPRTYAESILKICQLCVESPLPCVPGIAGASLKKRVVRIMGHRGVLKLGVRRKLLLAVAGFLAIAVPIGFGLANGRPVQANVAQTQASSQEAKTAAAMPKFEVVSIKPTKPGMVGSGMETPPGRFSATNVLVKSLIAFAYNYHQPGLTLLNYQILGGPKWINSARFDIDAKVEDSLVEQDEKKMLPQNEWQDQVRLRLQAMLADRFKLKVTQETKELPIYALVVAKHGPKLTKSGVPRIWRISGRGPVVHVRRGQFTGIALSTGDLAGLLSYLPEIGGRKVVDKTGLQDRYDFTLKWTPEQGQRFGRPRPSGTAGGAQSAAGRPAAPDSSGPSIFTALQQQLGLRLKPEKAPVRVLVIDHIEQPTPN